MLRCFPTFQVATTCFSCSPPDLNYVHLLYCVSIPVFTLDAGVLARSQYSEGPATGHLDTGFSRFPCVYKQMLSDGSQHSKLPLHASHVALLT